MKDATHITMLIDRSGSMASVKGDAEGAVNAFFHEQRQVEGDCTVHLWDFDAPKGIDDSRWLTQHFAGPIANVLDYKLAPRGSTALLDAVAMTIISTGSFLSALPEDERPDKVIFVIQTDGEENSSRKYSWEQVRDAIKVQTERYNWQVIFLGMGSDAWDQGQKMGISNNVFAADSGISHAHTHSVLNASATRYRSGQDATMDSMANVAVAASGKVTNKAGEELDPVTGKVINATS